MNLLQFPDAQGKALTYGQSAKRLRAWIGNVRDLYEYEKAPERFGLKTAYKLKSATHLNPDSFAKLKVKNAAQLLSESVAAGLEAMGKPYFGGTVHFLRFFDELFDILNSSSLKGCKPSRRALKTREQFTVRVIKVRVVGTKSKFLLDFGEKEGTSVHVAVFGLKKRETFQRLD